MLGWLRCRYTFLPPRVHLLAGASTLAMRGLLAIRDFKQASRLSQPFRNRVLDTRHENRAQNLARRKLRARVHASLSQADIVAVGATTFAGLITAGCYAMIAHRVTTSIDARNLRTRVNSRLQMVSQTSKNPW